MILLRLISWPYVRRHLARVALTTLGIVLGVAVFVAMYTANQAVLDGLEQAGYRAAPYIRRSGAERPLDDLADAKRRIGKRLFIKGNIDPVNTLLKRTRAEVREDALRRLAIGSRGGGYILSGIGIPMRPKIWPPTGACTCP